MCNSSVSLEELINNVGDIPTLPQVASRIISLTKDSSTTVQEIEREILKDQTLTAKVLKLANSAYYSYSRKISTVSQATVLLGFDTIKSITLTASLGNILSKELSGYALEEDTLLNQSQLCARISSLIAKKIKFKKVENAYIAGLLRDMGKLVLNQYMKDKYHEVVRKVELEKVTFLEAENAIIGFNHAEVGAFIAKKWNLPNELVEAIAYHHTPEKANESKETTAIVHIADAIVMMMGVGIGLDGLLYNFESQALELLGLSEVDIDQILSEAIEFLSD